MSIFYETGEAVEATEEVSVGGFKECIPHDTILLCRVLGVMYVEGKAYQNGGQADDKLRVDLEVMEEGKYKGRIESHGLKLWDTGAIYGGGNDEEKAAKNRKKAIEFLSVYDTLAGGKIAKHKKQWYDIIDDMTDMLADTEVLIKFGCTDAMPTFNPEKDRANPYIQAVSKPLEQGASKTKQATHMPPKRSAPAPTKADELYDSDDEIPF
jgi:hypothetical protein